MGPAYFEAVELSGAESMWLKVMGQLKYFPYMINLATSPDKRLMGHQLPSSEILFSHTTGTDEKGNESADQPKKKPKSAESLHVIGGYGTFSRAFGTSSPEGSLPVIYEQINSPCKKILRQKNPKLLKKKKHNVTMSKESSDLSSVAERADIGEKLGV